MYNELSNLVSHSRISVEAAHLYYKSNFDKTNNNIYQNVNIQIIE